MNVNKFAVGVFLLLLVESATVASSNSGDVYRDCSECPEMVMVPAGSFMMGDKGDWYSRLVERPFHQVTIDYPFAVGRYEVTFTEREACVAGGGCEGYVPDDFGFGRGARPVFNVSWNLVQSYIKWLNDKSGQTYRLLTEAEWEYMARAGTVTEFTTGEAITTDQANYNFEPHSKLGANGEKMHTLPVGSFPPNGFGIYDVHGNVREYVQDCWHENYDNAPTDGSAWIEGGNCAVRGARGGSWGDTKPGIRSASRSHLGYARGSVSYGFRLARAQ